MTPQEKAKEVFEKLVTGTNERSLIIAKKHSLILVDEILKSLKYEGIVIGSYYWEEVRSEINKL